jgi:hypothetical protein
MANLSTHLRVTDFRDTRTTKWQLESARVVEQERADLAIEKLWRSRVRCNPKEVARLRKAVA